MDNKNQKHKRRPRYKGTHPKAYQDKYKELQPDKYGDTIEKVLQKGLPRLACTGLFVSMKY